jgi:hypothetical protein
MQFARKDETVVHITGILMKKEQSFTYASWAELHILQADLLIIYSSSTD